MPVKAYARKNASGRTSDAGVRFACSSSVENVLTSAVGMLARVAIDRALCPSCPTAQAARAVFFSDDVLTRLGGMLGPFVVTAALLALVVQRLGARERRSDQLDPETKPLDPETKTS